MKWLLRTLLTMSDLILVGTLMLAITGSYLDARCGGWMQPAWHWPIGIAGTALLVLGALACLLLIGTLALAASAAVYLTDSYDRAAKAVLAYPMPLASEAPGVPHRSG